MAATTEEHYDDSAFSYFILAVLAIILIPSTIIYAKKWTKLLNSKYTGLCNCDRCLTKAQILRNKEKIPDGWSIVKFVLFIFFWAAFLYLLQSASSQSPQQTTQFDPYEILGISSGASKEEIKKAFRQLSLQYHPDKSKDPEAPSKYILIHKAYDTLTDDVTREKWEKYGNPDGPQAFSVKMALPSFLVDSKNSAFVLALYVVFLIVIFPTIALCFWQRQKEVAGNQLMNKTMGLYFNFIKENWRFKKLIDMLGAAEEYRLAIKERASDEEAQKKIKQLLPFNEPTKKTKKRTLASYVVKNKLLFYVHLSRLHKQLPQILQDDLAILLDKALLVLSGMLQASFARGFFIPTLEVLQMTQMVVQAVWRPNNRLTEETALLQIPHFTDDIVRKCSRKKINTIYQFAKASEAQRADILKGLSPAQIQDIESVCSLFPIDMDVSFTFNQPEDGEENALALEGGSIITITGVADRPSKPSSLNREELKKSVPLGVTPKEPEDTPIEAHCPFLPTAKNEVWWLLATYDKNSSRLVQLPKKITALRHKTEFSIQVPVPPKIGNYELILHLICDSYVGFDKVKTLKIRVTKDMPPQQAPHAHDKENGKKKEAESDEEEEEEEEEGGEDSSSSE